MHNMKYFLPLFLITLSVPATLSAQQSTGMNLLARMHSTFYKGPCRCYTFSQKNTHYRNDSVIGASVWHETVEFPDKFRIVFDDKKGLDKVVYRNDSVFRYKNGHLLKMRPDSNALLLFLGGMYYRPLEEVLQRMKALHYNPEVLSENVFNRQQVFVIGAGNNDLKTNQIWIDKESLRVVRIIELLNNGEVMDMRFESHQKMCRAYVETSVSFRRDGRLEQTEDYYDLHEAKNFGND